MYRLCKETTQQIKQYNERNVHLVHIFFVQPWQCHILNSTEHFNNSICPVERPQHPSNEERTTTTTSEKHKI